jgi:predicted GNAT family N-acyltransferase
VFARPGRISISQPPLWYNPAACIDGRQGLDGCWSPGAGDRQADEAGARTIATRLPAARSMPEPLATPRVTVRDLRDTADVAAIVAIRRQVFVIEQGVATSVEPDNVDRAAHHTLGLVDGRVVGIGRLHLTNGEGQIAWVAVLPAYRGQGIGRAIMARLIEVADVAGARVTVLNAQTHALRFYEHLGFRAIGEPFMMGGIEHQMMSRLRPPG